MLSSLFLIATGLILIFTTALAVAGGVREIYRNWRTPIRSHWIGIVITLVFMGVFVPVFIFSMDQLIVLPWLEMVGATCESMGCK